MRVACALQKCILATVICNFCNFNLEFSFLCVCIRKKGNVNAACRKRRTSLYKLQFCVRSLSMNRASLPYLFEGKILDNPLWRSQLTITIPPPTTTTTTTTSTTTPFPIISKPIVPLPYINKEMYDAHHRAILADYRKVFHYRNLPRPYLQYPLEDVERFLKSRTTLIQAFEYLATGSIENHYKKAHIFQTLSSLKAPTSHQDQSPSQNSIINLSLQ